MASVVGMLSIILWVLIIPVSVASYSATAGMNTMLGCKGTCEKSDVMIPYPFGIGKNCYHNSSEHYEIVCKPSNSTPGAFIPFLYKFNVEVFDIGFYFDDYENIHYSNFSGHSDATLCIAASDTQEYCTGEKGKSSSISSGHQIDDLKGTPFQFTYDNYIEVQGCAGQVQVSNSSGDRIGGCAVVCQDNALLNHRLISPRKCDGLGCCTVSLQHHMEYYEISLSHLSNVSVTHNNNTCINVTLFTDRTASGVPYATWHWKAPPILGSNHTKSYSCEDDYYTCYCKAGYEGNPYLPSGCKARRHQKTVITGLGISLGSITFFVCGYGMFHVIRRWIQIKRKAKFFKRNGGLLLQQQVTTRDNNVDKTKIFSVDELDKATDSFNANRILGRGGQGTVYKGMLLDGKVVAIKKSLKVDESQIEHFINEVVILSQISHRNIVRLLGCCLETEVPLLVYEFIPNGTLGQHIHNPSEDFYITWKMRLQIASESAGALAYLHSASATPIYHRDVKSSNILLDEKYKAKVADFGTSRSVMIDQTHLTTLVQGTLGYLDPEYFQTNQFTEKSDVYSFGVVLVELLTGQKPLSSAQSGGWKSLTMDFLLHMETFRLFDIIDSRILDEAKKEDLLSMANLAKRCLNLNGKQRPTMKEPANVLERITSSTMPSDVIYDIDVKEFNRTIEMRKMHEGDMAMSTFCSENVVGASSSTEVKPLMHYTV